MTRIEMVKKAFELLRDARGVDIEVSEVQERSNGDVYFRIKLGNGAEGGWSWPDSWFNPDHNHSPEVREHIDEVPQDLGDDAKIIFKMLIYLDYAVRYPKRKY